MQPTSDTFKAVSVRYIVNPELEDKRVIETEEMCRRTIERLEWLRDRKPRLVLMPDRKNRDPHCVMVMAMGRRVANLSKEDALEARGMMTSMGVERLRCDISEVVVGRHGYFFVRKPECCQPYECEPLGVDWSRWETEEMLILPEDDLLSMESLSVVIREDLLPCLGEAHIVDELREYLTLWMDVVRYNQCHEVQEEMHSFIRLLSADGREEVRQMAVEIDHLRTKKGTSEMTRELVDKWWTKLLYSRTVNDSFSLVKARCSHDTKQLWKILMHVNELMRTIPGELYNDVGDAYEFFSHLGYLAPPINAYRGVLSLYAIRTLVCEHLGISQLPSWEPLPAEITNVRDIPLTLGDVIDFKDAHADIDKNTMKLFAYEMQMQFFNHQTEEIAREGKTQIGEQLEAVKQTAEAIQGVAGAIRENPSVNAEHYYAPGSTHEDKGKYLQIGTNDKEKLGLIE